MEQNKKTNLKLLIVILFILIALLLSGYYFFKEKKDINKIVILYSNTSEYLYDSNDVVELELTGENFNKVKTLLKEVESEDCQCDYIEEAKIIINDSYTITIGKSGFGYREEKNSTNDYLVSIPDELYNTIKSIIDEKRNNTTSSLDNYEFTMDSTDKYIITTDMKWTTMQDDGGSHDNLYYQVDLENGVVVKIKDSYHANLSSEPSLEKAILYISQIDENLIKDARKTLDEIFKSEATDDNNLSYSIETLNAKKDVRDTEMIDTLKVLLSKFDSLNKKLVFSLESRTLKCPSPILRVFDDNTYEYYYTHSSKDKKLIPKTGKYNYNIDPILKDLEKYETDTFPKYALTDSINKEHLLLEDKELEEFLKSIDIDIHMCTIEQ